MEYAVLLTVFGGLLVMLGTALVVMRHVGKLKKFMWAQLSAALYTLGAIALFFGILGLL